MSTDGGLLQRLDLGRRVVSLLTESGYVVTKLEVDAFRGRPTIWLAPSPLCAELRGDFCNERLPDGSLLRTRAKVIEGVLVQWRVE